MLPSGSQVLSSLYLFLQHANRRDRRAETGRFQKSSRINDLSLDPQIERCQQLARCDPPQRRTLARGSQAADHVNLPNGALAAFPERNQVEEQSPAAAPGSEGYRRLHGRPTAMPVPISQAIQNHRRRSGQQEEKQQTGQTRENGHESPGPY